MNLFNETLSIFVKPLKFFKMFYPQSTSKETYLIIYINKQLSVIKK